MKNIFKRSSLFLLIFMNLFVLVACNKTYTITLKLYDDESYVVESKKVNDYNLPELSNRRQYFFKGWYDNENFEGEPITSLDVKKDMTLYAKWEYISKYQIIYCNNINGSYEESESYEYLYGYSELYFLERPFTYKSREIKGYSFINGGEIQVTDTIGDEEVLHYADQNGIVKLYTVWGGPYEIEYEIGSEIYNNKKDLRKDFLTDFYNFIASTEDGKKFLVEFQLTSDVIGITLDQFVKWGSGIHPAYEYEAYYFISLFGNSFRSYYLVDTVGGTLETQPETCFVGWCYKNNKWVDLLEFMVENAGYWSIATVSTGVPEDELKDYFIHSNRSLISTLNLFFYTKETSTAKTEEVLRCIDNIPGCMKPVNFEYLIDEEDIELPKLEVNGMKFGGWYDNPECVGQEITILKVSQVKSEITLYARWNKNE